ncbi:hypothetical protein G6F59_018985 [Rhizopus arrhizus]|nr:hypothetical protein G6F59_018985 [Rhizopus arrhizus]
MADPGLAVDRIDEQPEPIVGATALSGVNRRDHFAVAGLADHPPPAQATIPAREIVKRTDQKAGSATPVRVETG